MYRWQEILKTKYPIICSAMNYVNDYCLGKAVHNAGCLPSLLATKIKDTSLNFEELKWENQIDSNLDELRLFEETVTNNYINFTVANAYFSKLHHIMTNSSFVEIGGFNLQDEKTKYFIDYTKTSNKKIILRSGKPIKVDDKEIIILLSAKGAASASSNFTLTEVIKEQKNLCPENEVIVSGNISTGEKIDQALNEGALAVSIGTLFASSLESNIALSSKELFIQHTSNTIAKKGKNRNSILIKEYLHEDSPNFSKSLFEGIRGTGGHLYAGESVDKINAIEPVQKIVDRLVSESEILSSI